MRLKLYHRFKVDQAWNVVFEQHLRELSTSALHCCYACLMVLRYKTCYRVTAYCLHTGCWLASDQKSIRNSDQLQCVNVLIFCLEAVQNCTSLGAGACLTKTANRPMLYSLADEYHVLQSSLSSYVLHLHLKNRTFL